MNATKRGNGMDFESWFRSYEWFHENTARERLEPAWRDLKAAGADDGKIARALSILVSVMSNEYGE
jgi:hypothetical protein